MPRGQSFFSSRFFVIIVIFVIFCSKIFGRGLPVCYRNSRARICASARNKSSSGVRRPRQMEALTRRGGPRVAVLLVQHRHEQPEQPDPLFRVVRLPHADFQVRKPIRIERPHRPGAPWRREGEREDERGDNRSSDKRAFHVRQLCPAARRTHRRRPLRLRLRMPAVCAIIGGT